MVGDPEPIDPHDPRIGQRVGNYVLRGKIGEGGMGVVYLGEHPEIGTRVAVKFLRKEYAQKDDVAARFRQEARSVNAIDHENVVRITDFGSTEDGGLYLVMEMLVGRSLAEVIANDGALPLERAIPIFRGVARGLQAAHAREIVHRDLKPDNLFIVRREGNPESVRILDFGIAKIIGGADGKGAMMRLTSTGAIVGTPQYMSPEQIEGAAIDARSDIYSFGVILYEAIVGEPPFKADTFGRLLKAHLDEIPRPLRQRRPDLDLPDAIEHLTLACLEKEREKRPQSMAEVLELLEVSAEAMGLPRNATVFGGGFPGGLASLRTPPRVSPEDAVAPTLQSTPMPVGLRRSGPVAAAGGSRPGSGSGSGPGVAFAAGSALSSSGSGSLGIHTPSPQPVSRTLHEAPKSRFPWLVAAGVIAVGGLAAGVFFMFGGSREGTRMATADPSRMKAAGASIGVDLRTTPPGATVFVDGKKDDDCAATPCTVRVSRTPGSGAKREAELELWLEGYETARRSVPRDRDALLEVGLVEIGPATAAPVATPAPASAAPGSASPKTARPKPGKTAKPSKKPGTSDLDGFVDPFKDK